MRTNPESAVLGSQPLVIPFRNGRDSGRSTGTRTRRQSAALIWMKASPAAMREARWEQLAWLALALSALAVLGISFWL